ncbi:hypothetical protein BDV09DRAFT_139944 [Aspergillus tetrazonus]
MSWTTSVGRISTVPRKSMGLGATGVGATVVVGLITAAGTVTPTATAQTDPWIAILFFILDTYQRHACQWLTPVPPYCYLRSIPNYQPYPGWRAFGSRSSIPNLLAYSASDEPKHAITAQLS